MSTSRITTALGHDVNSTIQRCVHTRLTKPECHCRACLFEQIAAHSKRPQLAALEHIVRPDREAA